MGGVSIGPRIQVEGEEEYRKKIIDIIEQSKTLGAEMKALTASFAEDATAQEKATATSKLLNEQLEAARKRTELVREMTEQATKAKGEDNVATLKWRQALATAKEEQARLEKAVADNTKALENEGEEAEDAGKSLKKLGEEADGASEKTSIFSDILKGDLASKAISAAKDGIEKLGKMVVDFGKKVVQSYGDLQQNVGGSVSVFGGYAEQVRKAAEMAYSSMGASESEYLATANKMGALFQGSGVEVERSMELTVQAMQRAADAASVMGIDTSAALEAVTGAAKGNYTMMDNLGVKMDATTLKAYALEQGMAATWEEMSNAEKAELAMQYFFEQTEQYAGNFEAEARETISGSIGMLHASVDSWVAGLGDAEADVEQLTQNMIDSFETVVKNTVPVVENIILSLPKVSETVKNEFAELTPELDGIRSFLDNGFVKTITELGTASTPLGAFLVDFKAFLGLLYDVKNAQSETAEATEEDSGRIAAAIGQATDIATADINALREAYDAAYEATKKSLDGQFGLWEKAGEVTATSTSDMLEGLQSQIDYWNEYESNFNSLVSRNIEGIEEFAKNFDDGSLASAKALAGLKDATDEEIRQIIEKMKETEGAKADIAGEFAELETDVSGSLEKIKEDYAATVENINTETGNIDFAPFDAAVEAAFGGMETRAATAAENAVATIQAAINTINSMQIDPVVEQSTQWHDNNAGHNAAGTDSWRGGLTWVGESGPELVRLPQGTQIIPNQQSMQLAGAGTDTRALEGLVGQAVTLLREIQAERQAESMRGRMRRNG